MTIWVVESGEYEQRGVDLVAATPEAARAGLIEQHEKFYREHPEHADNFLAVEWSELLRDGEDFKVIKTYRDTRVKPTEYTISQYDYAS